MQYCTSNKEFNRLVFLKKPFRLMACAGAFPIVPDRLSYSEMYPEWMKVKCNSDEDLLNAVRTKMLSVDRCRSNMKEHISNRIKETKVYVSRLFFSANLLIDKINSSNVQ